MNLELDSIIIEGASEHNLKNIRIEIPKKKLVVLTGVSGSGKSSLAFDTLYVEGQRRYIESLSSYARQFLGQMEKPRYESIRGLTPTIAIDQKASSVNPRSTVGTITEINDYLRVLFARVGRQYCWSCGEEVSSQSVQQIIDDVLRRKIDERIIILAPVITNRKGEHKALFASLQQKGYLRVRVDSEVRLLEEDIKLDKNSKHTIDVVVDRLIVRDISRQRFFDSIETALELGKGTVKVLFLESGEEIFYSEHNACAKCGISYSELIPQLFSFNSPQGMCKSCNGLGVKLEMDPGKVVPDENLSILEGAIHPWANAVKNRKGWTWKYIENIANSCEIPLDVSWKNLPEKKRKIILWGSGEEVIDFHMKGKISEFRYRGKIEGVLNTLKRRLRQTNSEDARKSYMKYFSDTICPECHGTRLRKQARFVKINDMSIVDFSNMSIGKLFLRVNSLKLEGKRKIIAEELLKEIRNRLKFLIDVGLGYLTLDRAGPTLSGGESQRIRLASQLGTELTGVTYVLDEPSVGLHQKDNIHLINSLKHLRDIGNTVVVVEHDRETIEEADHVIDFGPGAGIHGGEVIFSGSPEKIKLSDKSLTGKYLSQRLTLPIPDFRRKPGKKWIKMKGVKTHNLKNIDVEIPLGVLTFITGVSGAGKSSLINETLYPVLKNRIMGTKLKEGEFSEIEGVKFVNKVIEVDQKPIGKTPRSNPATYTKVFDLIRKVFANQKLSLMYGYKAGRFSFNVKGGRCENCRGDGLVKVEMHFLPDVYVPCDVCHGLRFNEATLRVKYRGLNIADVLDLTVEEAQELFENFPAIKKILDILKDVGLGYIKLGQPSPTLSGGEAQRVKLARELSKNALSHTFYILDEPTTGLHFEDIKKLIAVLNRFVQNGHTVVVIEHNLDAICCADYIIDLGPEGGDRGGEVVAFGTPEEIALNEKSWTGQYLAPLLRQKNKNV